MKEDLELYYALKCSEFSSPLQSFAWMKLNTKPADVVHEAISQNSIFSLQKHSASTNHVHYENGDLRYFMSEVWLKTFITTQSNKQFLIRAITKIK